ncbi:MAG: hypothetical protein LBG45_09900 [Dysgonamonadaceae bacterium]|jgi:hypothetical protein|nr:hypothetical protein [Dysgonamonadaceae bacterium]
MKRFFKKTAGFGLLFLGVVLFFAIGRILLIRNDKDAYIMAFFAKREMLAGKNHRQQQSIILLGGSNVAFGFDSRMIREATGLPVINTGVTAHFGLKFMLDNIAEYLRKGDILIVAPEYHHFYGNKAYGWANTDDIIALICLDTSVISGFDTEQFKMALCNAGSFLCHSISVFAKWPVNTDMKGYKRSGFNEYGDYVKHRTMPSRPYTHASPADFDTINTAFLDYCENAVAALRNRGIQVIIIPPSFAETSYRKVEERLIPLFSELGKRNLGFSIPPQESAYPDSLFFDTHYHLSHEGVLIRTKQLVRLMETGGFVR